MPEKPNILSPTLREKKRYIAYQILSDQKIDFPDLANAVWHSLLNFLGELETANSQIWILRNTYIEDRKIGLIKCSPSSVELIRTALALVQQIKEAPAIIRVIGVSGTISAAKRKYFGERDLRDFS